MTAPIKLCIYLICSFLLSAIVAKPIIKMLTKLKAGQNILGYVSQHERKNGTPTIGGLIFLLPVIIVCIVEWTPFSLITLGMIFGFATLGFLDDFIKIKFNRNLGLKAYQKIIGQLGLSVIAAYFCYKSDYVGTSVNIPYLPAIDMKWGIIPFVIFVFVATTNSVNLTDGIDGLAGSTSLCYFAIFAVVLFFVSQNVDMSSQKEILSLCAVCASLVGGLLAYLIFNSNPASVFMGDTGSLGLGGAVASVAVFSKNPLFIVTTGIIFVWSSISVIIQVIYFKLTKGKRVFLMSPYHHHLEMKGMSESKICALYSAITVVGGMITIVLAGGL